MITESGWDASALEDRYWRTSGSEERFSYDAWNAAVREFVSVVCVEAERTMLATGKLEGAHYAAIQRVLTWLGLEMPA